MVRVRPHTPVSWYPVRFLNFGFLGLPSQVIAAQMVWRDLRVSQMGAAKGGTKLVGQIGVAALTLEVFGQLANLYTVGPALGFL